MSDMQRLLCVDDFGSEVYKCHWTGKPIAIPDAVVIGGFMPGVKSKFICHPDYIEARKLSHKSFNESEANCNTCKHLFRVKREKNAGFLYGECLAKSKEVKIYPVIDNVMMFHPDDWMGMKCYEHR